MGFIRKYKLDIAYFSIITILFLFLSFIFFEKSGDLIIDCGREAYFPLEVLKGKVLYKDIFNIFAPLSYQLNAFLYSIWGVNLAVLNIAGLVNAYITLLTVYLISRTLTKPVNSVVICFTIMILCFFKTFIHNFIFPYSYAIVYAVSFFVISVLFSIYYFIKSKPWLIICAFFFMGASFASKYEFALFLLLLILIILFFKPLSKLNILMCFISFLAVPLTSFTILFFQGLSFADFVNSMHLIIKFASTKAYNTFLYNAAGFYFNYAHNKQHLFYTTYSAPLFFKLFIIVYITLFSINIIFKGDEKIKNFINIFAIFFFIAKIMNLPQLRCFIKDSFPFIGYTTVIIAVVTILYLKFSKIIELKDKIFLFLVITALIASSKAIFYVDIDSYGAFLILLPVVVNFIFILDYLPKLVKFIDKKALQYTFIVMIISTAAIFLTRELKIIKILTYPIITERGTIYSIKQRGIVFHNTLSFINNEIPKKSTLLVVPEGLLINFLSERSTYNKFYCLIPNHIETFGEDNIVRVLKNNLPDYIITDNVDSSWYGYKYFGIDYGFKINSLITKNYTFIKEFKSEYFYNKDNPYDSLFHLNVKIYKLKTLLGQHK